MDEKNDRSTPRETHPGTATPIASNRPMGDQFKPYNCHSFAWHDSKGDRTDKRNDGLPPRWDNNPSDDMKNATPLSLDAPNQVGDIIVYGNDKNSNGSLEPKEIDHSARVTEVDSEGNTTRVESKEGQSNVTDHHPSDQNPEYGDFKEIYRKDEKKK